MKKKIIFGSLLMVCLLMISPSVSAVEFNTSIEEQMLELQSKGEPFVWFLALLAVVVGMILSYIWHTREI